MRVLFTCADKPTISRNRFHRQTLRERFEYAECVSSAKSYPLRIPKVLACLPFKIPSADFVFVAYMGHFLVPYIRFFTKKPIVFDFYLSIYDMLCIDRKLFSPDSLMGRFIFRLEQKALKQADYVIVDTQKLIDTLSQTYDVPRQKFVKVHLTIDESQVFSVDVPRYHEDFTVLYVGSYIPLHGTPVIIETARILQERGEKVRFLMIGQGPDYQKCRDLAKKYDLKNIDFKGFMPLSELNRYYNACDINLGLFNTGERANSVVLNKTNDAFRVGRPHLTLKTDAMQEAFEDNVDIFFVPDIRPQTLADRIIEIKNNPDLLKKVGQNARRAYESKLSNHKAKEILEEKIFTPLEHHAD